MTRCSLAWTSTVNTGTLSSVPVSHSIVEGNLWLVSPWSVLSGIFGQQCLGLPEGGWHVAFCWWCCGRPLPVLPSWLSKPLLWLQLWRNSGIARPTFGVSFQHHLRVRAQCSFLEGEKCVLIFEKYFEPVRQVNHYIENNRVRFFKTVHKRSNTFCTCIVSLRHELDCMC